jgi:hypothetical protein
MLARGDALLARWFERLAATDDAAGIVTLYAKHRTVIDTHAGGATARRIADALDRMALPEAALRLLRLRDRGDDPAHTMAVGRAALRAGEPALARDALSRVPADGLAPALRIERARLAAAVAAASGHPEEVDAAVLAGDASLATQVARAWLTRGDDAAERAAWDEAAVAYDRARAITPNAGDRAAAAAALAAVRPDGTPPATGDALASVDDPVVRRALALVEATRRYGVEPAAKRGGGGGR